ncbi:MULTISPECIES: YebG family protein [Alkalimonas]|uniref:YebG family protein n=1 Tax=Alkalimonas mucilaginosa TaxID=3057676 RepID=A0ABU7JDJ0_9GAMM|nr:YebG family protein [Alkalimonas sp. MEB004]MEE2023764.1 YebG family protein [Alkalimonas sp. MEB004]
MAVIVKYVVERNGEEKMTFSSKAEADAYDKMLDIADELTEFLEHSTLIPEQATQEALALYLAQHKDELISLLSNKRKAAPTKTKATPSSPATTAKEQAA